MTKNNFSWVRQIPTQTIFFFKTLINSQHSTNVSKSAFTSFSPISVDYKNYTSLPQISGQDTGRWLLLHELDTNLSLIRSLTNLCSCNTLYRKQTQHHHPPLFYFCSKNISKRYIFEVLKRQLNQCTKILSLLLLGKTTTTELHLLVKRSLLYWTWLLKY